MPRFVVQHETLSVQKAGKEQASSKEFHTAKRKGRAKNSTTVMTNKMIKNNPSSFSIPVNMHYSLCT
ncbi:hypothetical protein NHP21005_16700 [Helicobacter sp. NHP21005]|nr:hypothetical protein NHP21005_16700 [Helicobacter sp. NHP21005]